MNSIYFTPKLGIGYISDSRGYSTGIALGAAFELKINKLFSTKIGTDGFIGLEDDNASNVAINLTLGFNI